MAPVSGLDPAGHGISGLEGLLLLYGRKEILWCEIKGRHQLHGPGHSLAMRSPAGLSKCYTSHGRLWGKAKEGSEDSSRKFFFLQPVTNPKHTQPVVNKEERKQLR